MTAAIVKHSAAPVAQRTDVEPMSWADMMSMGDHLVRTGFLPQHLKTGAQVAAVILTGRELGMPPMTAVRCLSLVKGKVVEAADSQLARFKADGGRAVFSMLDATRATLDLTHPNGDKHTETFSIEDAKKAGLSGDNWQKYTKAMLRSRCITAGLKSLGWQGAVGTYDPDEALTFDAPQTPTAATSKPANGPTDAQAKEIKASLAALGITNERGAYLDSIYEGAETVEDYAHVVEVLRARLKDKAARELVPTAEEEIGQTRQSTIVEPAKPDPLTDEHRGILIALLEKGGAKLAAAKLAIVGGILEREVESFNDVSDAEGLRVIGALRGGAA